MTTTKILATLGAIATLTMGGLVLFDGASEAEPPRGAGAKSAPPPEDAATKLAEATFAGGCFWCMEAPFDDLPGVASTTSGYTGGPEEKPTYEQVSSGRTGHTEAVRVVYDPERVSYEKLLDVFWRNIDPLTANRQFCDGGSQYRSGVFVHDEEQRRLAEASKKALETSGRFGERPLVTEITDAGPFWRAEEYHQDFYRKNPIRYGIYRRGCGRDARLRELWGEDGGH